MGFWSSLFFRKPRSVEIREKLCHKEILVPLTPAEAEYLLLDSKWKKKGMLFLARRPGGECWYLTPEGCGIWEKRPKACRIRRMRDIDDLEK